MCFGPELLLMGLASLASVGGSMIASSEAQSNAKRVAAARNAELQFVLNKQRQLAEQNDQILKPTVDKFSKENQQKTADDALAKRTAAIVDSTPSPTQTNEIGTIPLAGNTPQVIKDSIAGSLLGAYNDATNKAKAVAKLGSYNDVWNTNNLGIQESGRGIDTNNTFARDWASLLPSLQDLAGAAANRPSSGFGQILSGLGGLGASAAGGGFKMFG